VGRGRLGDPCGEVLGTQGKRKIAYVGAREYIRYRMLQIRIGANNTTGIGPSSEVASMNLDTKVVESSESFVGPKDQWLRCAGSHPTEGIPFSLKSTSKLLRSEPPSAPLTTVHPFKYFKATSQPTTCLNRTLDVTRLNRNVWYHYLPSIPWST
jgi:hypothetical protein